MLCKVFLASLSKGGGMGNNLSEELKNIMQSELGDMGNFVIAKQCKDLEIDPDNVLPAYLPKLAKALSTKMQLFVTDKSKNLYDKLLQL